MIIPSPNSDLTAPAINSGLLTSGRRPTKTRRGILKILSGDQPCTAPEILDQLARAKVVVNKTTVYRELDFLLAKNILSEVMFKDGARRYEIRMSGHSHHLVCLNCRKVERVPLTHDLDGQEKEIAHRRNFKILSHSLEFYGLCPSCLKK